MTYNVFGGSLNPTLLLLYFIMSNLSVGCALWTLGYFPEQAQVNLHPTKLNRWLGGWLISNVKGLNFELHMQRVCVTRLMPIYFKC